MSDDKKIVIPIVVIERAHESYEIYSPDFDLSVYGDNYIEAITSATFKISAIYYYNAERNSFYKLKCTYNDADAIAAKKRNAFATYTTLVP